MVHFPDALFIHGVNEFRFFSCLYDIFTDRWIGQFRGCVRFFRLSVPVKEVTIISVGSPPLKEVGPVRVVTGDELQKFVQ